MAGRPAVGRRKLRRLLPQGGRKALNLYLSTLNELKGEEGQDLAEYALLLGLIAFVAVFAVVALGRNISIVFNAAGQAVAGVPEAIAGVTDAVAAWVGGGAR
jgi:Flp pilus assembly pilin Flp